MDLINSGDLVDRRNPASIPTMRKAQPYFLLSPPRSKRDVRFCFVLLLTGIFVFVWFVVWRFVLVFGFFFKKKFGEEACAAAICKGCIPSRDTILIPRGKQVKRAVEEQSSIPYAKGGETFSTALCYPPPCLSPQRR